RSAAARRRAGPTRSGTPPRRRDARRWPPWPPPVAVLVLGFNLRAQPLLGLRELGGERRAEVRRVEDLPELERRALGEGRASHPGDGLVLRLHLDQPEAGDQLLRLG